MNLKIKFTALIDQFASLTFPFINQLRNSLAYHILPHLYEPFLYFNKGLRQDANHHIWGKEELNAVSNFKNPVVMAYVS